jgi:parvulin-like peptidyl-prolyl isomerase
MKPFFLIVSLAFCKLSVSQSIEEIKKVLENVTSYNQIDSLKRKHLGWRFSKKTVSLAELAEQNFDQKNLNIRSSDHYHMAEKIMDTTTISEYRVRYIYLDGIKNSKTRIDSLRQLLLKQYRNGTSFKELAEQYSADPSKDKGGDLGWFPAGRMVAPFEKAIKEHNKNDLFLAEFRGTYRPWYFVILKTHEDRLVTVARVLTIQVKK